MCDLYPQETISFNALPEDCPVKILDYGLMTEMIQDKVSLARRKGRDMIKDGLVKNLELRHLKNCLYELDRLGRLDPSNAVINLYKKKTSLVSSKKSIKTYLDTNFVPLVYLEEALDIQKKGHCKYEIGDRVKYKRKDGIYLYGIISSIIGSTSNKKYQVDMAKQRSFLNEDGQNEFYPDFMDINDSGWWPKCISGWDLEFMGKENEASQRLRQKFKEDNEESTRLRLKVWTKLEPLLLEAYKERIYDVPHLVNNRETIIANERQRILGALAWPSSGITDDELFVKGVMFIVKTQLIPMCKKAWFRKEVNVLDKRVWENVNDVDNLLHKICMDGNYCGFKICQLQSISAMIKRYNVLD